MNIHLRKNKSPRKTAHRSLEYGEVLLDSINQPNFNLHQMEGQLDQPISQKSLYWLSGVCLVVLVVLGGRLFNLQVLAGNQWFTLAEANRLDSRPVFSQRGVIYDRNNTPLAWNSAPQADEPFLRRQYVQDAGFGHILGFVRLPKKDAAGFFWRLDLEGVSGLEAAYNSSVLSGVNGAVITETTATLDETSTSVVKPAVSGKNLVTTIHAQLQQQLHKAIVDRAAESQYQGGAGVIMDIHTGDILAMTNFPDYNPNALMSGEGDEFDSYFTPGTTVFLNRAAAGLYSPGSTIKPFVAIGALNEEKITEQTHIESTGKIEITNRFNDNVATWRDWKPGGHGWVTVKEAIGDSVNTFFYAIGGGYKDQDGIGISGIERYTNAFGFAQPTGIVSIDEALGTIPNPEWKQEVFDDAWRLGDTYNSVLGQFGFQVTPLQMARAIGGLATGGILATPRLSLSEPVATQSVTVDIDPYYYDVVRAGMRYTVTDGTAKALNGADISVASKTGTAQVGTQRQYVNSWSTGFFPYENPQYAFAIVLEKGPNTEETKGATWVMHDFLQWLDAETPPDLQFLIDQTPENQ